MLILEKEKILKVVASLQGMDAMISRAAEMTDLGAGDFARMQVLNVRFDRETMSAAMGAGKSLQNSLDDFRSALAHYLDAGASLMNAKHE